MDSRTINYLEGRFRDYYRKNTFSLPPEAESREWGYIPWNAGENTRMMRHKSLREMGDIDSFLKRTSPQHMYFSASKYDDPGAPTMDEKDWQSSDLIFDLDADHLSTVTLGEDSYAEMLEKCKQMLLRLLDFLETDFGFEDVTVVFSGGRGYHVHVRDAEVQKLESEPRREFVDYVIADNVSFANVVTESDNIPRVSKHNNNDFSKFRPGGGWSYHIHKYTTERFETLFEQGEEEFIKTFTENSDAYKGIGETKARNAYNAFKNNPAHLPMGLIAPSMERVVEALAEEAIENLHAEVDQPVTTDINRLIRFPGSLHGGSALKVCHLDRDEIADFDPLQDAVPDVFTSHEVNINVTDGGTVELLGETYSLDEGETTVTEAVALFLMARGRAEKLQE